MSDEIKTESRTAFHELLATLQEIDRRWASAEWNLLGPADVADAHRALLHMIEGGIKTFFEADPTRPRFQRIVGPTRKFTGDNADAIYHDAAVDPKYTYRVRGSMDGAVYCSFTVECDTADGSMATRTGGVINDTKFDVDADGRFEIRFGGAPRSATGSRSSRTRRASRRGTTTRTRPRRPPTRSATPRSRSR